MQRTCLGKSLRFSTEMRPTKFSILIGPSGRRLSQFVPAVPRFYEPRRHCSPPSIPRSALTGSRRDPIIGLMLPQPSVLSNGEARRLDSFQSYHQWMVLGLGVDPRALLSKRDLNILDRLDAQFICLNGASTDDRTVPLQCHDPEFAAWVKRYSVRALLVRPDRFIADRICSRRTNLTVVDVFEQTCRNNTLREAA